MLKLKPEFLSKNGRREFVVLTVEDFERVKQALEDAEDLRILREARRLNANKKTFTIEEVKRRLKLSQGRAAKA